MLRRPRSLLARLLELFLVLVEHRRDESVVLFGDERAFLFGLLPHLGELLLQDGGAVPERQLLLVGGAEHFAQRSELLQELSVRAARAVDAARQLVHHPRQAAQAQVGARARVERPLKVRFAVRHRRAGRGSSQQLVEARGRRSERDRSVRILVVSRSGGLAVGYRRQGIGHGRVGRRAYRPRSARLPGGRGGARLHSLTRLARGALRRKTRRARIASF